MFKKALEQYCILVDDIHMHMLLLRSYPELPNPINCYERYIRHVNPFKHEYQRRFDYEWTILQKPKPGPGGKLEIQVSFLQLATFMQLSTSGPKWGRNIQQKKSWTLIIMVGVQLLMNKSQLDNHDDDQDPPPPKKQKVVHESSDNRNLGT